MAYELFVSKVSSIVKRLGFSARFSTDGEHHVAKVSDGTVITGDAFGNMVSFALPGGNTIKTGI